MEKEKSTMTIRFNNPDAVNTLKTIALIKTGRTMKGFIHQLIADWLVKEYGMQPKEVVELLGFKK